jgi:transcriptional regulator GlxA family with amidase domain
MTSVALAVTDGIPLIEVAAPCEVFGVDRSDLADPWYDFAVCGPDDARVGGWFKVDGPAGLDVLVAADTVIVPACRNVHESQPADLVDAVRAAHERGARVVSICSGAFVLAEAGLLDGRRATAHWLHADLLAQRYPRVRVDPEVLYLDTASSPRRARRPGWICACTSCGSTTAPRSPMRWPGGWWWRRTAPVGRPSSSPRRCRRSAATTAWPSCCRGRSRGSSSR